MYEIIPKRTNKAPEYVCFIMIITAFLAMFFTTLPSLPFRSLMQLGALILLGVALMLLGRYVYKAYAYAIIQTDEGELDFTVTELKRRSRITVCRIGLNGIEKIVKVTKENKKEIEAERRGRKVFNYCVDMSPTEEYYIFSEECGESLLIKLSPDEKLFELISGNVKNVQADCENEEKGAE